MDVLKRDKHTLAMFVEQICAPGEAALPEGMSNFQVSSYGCGRGGNIAISLPKFECGNERLQSHPEWNVATPGFPNRRSACCLDRKLNFAAACRTRGPTTKRRNKAPTDYTYSNFPSKIHHSTIFKSIINLQNENQI